MNLKVNINPPKKLISDRGLEPMGRTQQYIDNECMRRMVPYMPFLSGALSKSSTLGTVIGTGEVKQNVPYARYQYYGKLMVSSITGSAWSKGEEKVLTDKDLVHNKAYHPKAGPYWFERMKADHKDRILKGAQKIADRR